jgi:hypothetical protein
VAKDDGSETPESPSKSAPRGRLAATLRHALFAVVLVAFPLVVYFAFYREARVEQTKVRNFRALETAAKGLRDVIENLPAVVRHVPVGFSNEGLEQLEERARQESVRLDELHALLKENEETKEGEIPTAVAAEIDRQTHALGWRNPVPVLDVRCYREILGIRNIPRDYLHDLEAASGSKLFRVDGIAKAIPPPTEMPPESAPAENRSAQKTPPDRPAEDGCTLAAAALMAGISGDKTKGSGCNGTPVTRRLTVGARGAEVEAIDCRSLSERSPQLHKALQDGRLTQVLETYGVRVVADLRGLMRNVASNVAPLFDEFVIADAEGRVLYTADEESLSSRLASHQRARLDFANQVDLETLIAGKEQPGSSSLAEALEALGGTQSRKEPEEWSVYGVHTRLQSIEVADIGFEAFVHPFAIEGLSYAPPNAKSGEQAAEDDDDPDKVEPVETARNPSTRLFMVGIVSKKALDGESLALRLATVSDALLVISMLFVSLSLVWLWTAGDRLVLGFEHFLMLIGAGMVATFVFTLFTLQLATRATDSAALDASLGIVSERLRGHFAIEVDKRIALLAGETAKMLSHGRTEAHDKSVVDLEAGYACRPKDNTGWQERAPASPPYELAFLLDAQGWQWQCLSYRGFDTPPVKLAFREYFERPRRGPLWQLASLPSVSAGSPRTDEDRPAPTSYYMDRIFSILDGTTETVLSARPRELIARAAECRPPRNEHCEKLTQTAGELVSAVIIGRFRSLEEAVLPPHVQFAVVDDATGKTLFHSVRSRALRTHFVRETGDDAALLALIGARNAGMVDVDYDGTPIRAYVTPLEDGLPWTLITYREFELEDTLGVMTVAATAICVLGQLVVIAVILLVLRFLLLRRLSVSQALWRTRLLASASSATTRWMLFVIAFAGCAVLARYLSGLPTELGGVASAVPFAALLTLVWAWWGGSEDDRGDEGGEVGRGALFTTVALLFATLAVLPTCGWFLHYRQLLTAAVADHLIDAADDEIVAKCERHRAYARRYKTAFALDSGGGNPSPAWKGIFDRYWLFASAPANGKARDRWDAQLCAGISQAEERRASVMAVLGGHASGRGTSPGEDRVDVIIEKWFATFSPLAEDMAARIENTAPAPDGTAPGSLLETLLGVGPGEQARLGFLERLQIVAVVLLGLGLVYFVALSLVDRIFGAQSRLETLPGIEPDAVPKKWRKTKRPLRACVIHQSEKGSRGVVMRLLQERFPCVERAQWTKEKGLEWTPSSAADWINEEDEPPVTPPPGSEQTEPVVGPSPDSKEVLYVVEGFEAFASHPDAGAALLDALERLVAERKSVLLLTRIVPGYWLARITDEASNGDSVTSKAAVTTMRWSRVIGPLDTRRLASAEPTNAKALFEQRSRRRDLDRLSDSEQDDYDRIRKTLMPEAIANPELFELAASVARKASLSPQRGSPVENALQRFTAAAAGHFQTIWATSTMEEQLQLYALARGGFANPTRTAVLSSLANRGLIESDGLVRMKSVAFGDFIANDLIHDALLAWRDQGNGNTWRSIWPPVLLMVVLALAFFINSTPEALGPLTTVLVGGLATLPVVGALLQRVRDLKPPSGT